MAWQMLLHGVEGFMRFRFAPLAAACFAAAVIGAGCGGKVSASKIETRSETKATNPDGSHATTTTESKQFGSTLVSRTERTDDNGKHKERSTEETVVGTVTAFTAGKSIVILTGDGAKHDYSLSDKKTTANVDRRVTVGSKVELDSAHDDSGNRSIRVVPAA
jgi:hypothetical protein